MAAPTSRLRVVEFYSGIGGMHYAVKESRLDAAVVAAVDINNLANKVYKHNFPHVNLMQRNIQSITLEEFHVLDADIFLMSPPCQPFTRVGLKGDLTDPRTQSFLHLLETLPSLAKMPDYILVENVQGFETSQTRTRLVQTLEQGHYTYQEFLLSPTHFGIPNQRLRYFLLAKRRPLVFGPANISQREHRILQRQRLKTACHLRADAVSKTQTFEDKAQLSEISCCHEGSCSKCVANRTIPSDCQTGQKSAPLNTGAFHKGSRSSCDKVRCEELSGHEDGHSDCFSNGISDSLAGAVASSTCPVTEDCLEGDVLSTCECSSKKLAEQGSSDFTTGGSCPAVPNQFGALLPEACDKSSSRRTNVEKVSCKNVVDYLEKLPAEEAEQQLLPDRLLKRFARIVDVVTATDCNTRCFTKAYGHYVEGTGSMLQMNSTTKGTSLLKNCHKEIERIPGEYLEQLKCLRIRYFTPREIANLHHFPETFVFPAELTRKQRYRCLGNSLNVHVVSVLLKYLVNECAH